jgi:tetratricopeptide (TPR) repeat protein
MENLMLDGPIDISNRQKQVVLILFIDLNNKANAETGHDMYRVSLIRLKENLVKLLGSMELFHEQGLHMTTLGGMFMSMKHYEVAKIYFQEVRDIGVAHGFFTMECKACLGLGRIAMKEGRLQEGLELLQNALCASSLLLPEDNPREYEINAFYWLIDALFDTGDIDEAEKLMVRMAATVKQDEKDYIQINDMRVMIDKTRLYQTRGQHQAAVGQIQTLLAKVRKDVVYVCKWRAEFLRGIYGAKSILSDIWNKNLDESLADVVRML